MQKVILQFKQIFTRVLLMLILTVFSLVNVIPLTYVQASRHPNLKSVLYPSKVFSPVLFKGLSIDQNDPFRFEFLMDSGDSNFNEQEFRDETYKILNYFLTSLTIPEEDLWVNLSPYEKDRIIPENFGKTEMGRDLLAQDYVLKKFTASLMHPETESGQRFWDRVYERAQELGGKVDPSINVFNKVWIVPETGHFFEHKNTVYISDSKLRVMLEEDYVALQKDLGGESYGLDSMDDSQKISEEAKNLIREIMIPIIEKEVNEGKHFANLRQAYNSMLLAVWFKRRLQNHVFGMQYVNQHKVDGIDLVSQDSIEGIWNQYVETFKVGIFNFITEKYDERTQEIIPQRYFSGGTVAIGDIASGSQNIVKVPDKSVVVKFDSATISDLVESDAGVLPSKKNEIILGGSISKIDFRKDKPDATQISYYIRHKEKPISLTWNIQHYETEFDPYTFIFFKVKTPSTGPYGKQIAVGRYAENYIDILDANPDQIFDLLPTLLKDEISIDINLDDRNNFEIYDKVYHYTTDKWGKNLVGPVEEFESVHDILHESSVYSKKVPNDKQKRLQAYYNGEDTHVFMQDDDFFGSHTYVIEGTNFTSFIIKGVDARLHFYNMPYEEAFGYLERAKRIEADQAALVRIGAEEDWTRGGVNLRSDQADIQIHEEANGFKFPMIDSAMLEGEIKMLVPTILKISPLQPQEARFRLGLVDVEKNGF